MSSTYLLASSPSLPRLHDPRSVSLLKMTWLTRRRATGAINNSKSANPSSVGIWISKSSGYNFWEIDGSARGQWIRLASDIQNFLDEQSDPVPWSVIWSGYMVGKTTEAAKPTVIFCSRDPTARKLVRELIRTSRLLDKYPGFITAERERPPDFGKLVPLQEEQSGNQASMTNILSSGMVYAKAPDGEWRQAAIGGIVIIRKVKYYFTVAHIFTQASDFLPWDQSDDFDGDGFEIDEDENDPINQTGSDLVAITSTASISPAPSSSSEATGSSAASSSISTSRHRRRVESGIGRIVEAPEGDARAIPDAGLAFERAPALLPPNPSALNVPENSMDQHSSQTVLISTSEQAESLDYALLEIPEDETERAEKYVMVKPPADWRRNKPRETEIMAITARNVPLPGRLVGSPSFITSGAGRKAQEIWTVQLFGNLAGGDCGTWVVDAQTRELYGHIVAGSPDNGVAYIIPAYQVFDDARRQLGPIRLPSPPARVISSLLKHALRKLLPPTQELKVTLFGLDACGKTSLLYVLKTGELPTTIPTIGYNVESVQKGNVIISIWDVGGADKVRPLWPRLYCDGLDGFVFMVDVTDTERMHEAREALQMLLAEPALKGTPLLVLGNKSDLGGVSAHELAEALELKTIRDRSVALYLISAARSHNLDLVVRWLVALIIGRDWH